MNELPSGTVTFLFTDIEGSTRLWQEQPEAMAVSHARHDEILRTAVESNHGYVFQIVGDSFSAAFHNAIDGLKAVLSAQRRLQAEIWGETGAIKVRMGLHTGTAELFPDGKYEGYATIASTQRVMSAAHGGQTLLTQTTYELLQNALPDALALRDMGEHRLKDLRTPLRLYQVNAQDLPQDFPPIKSLDTQPNNLPAQLTSFIGREKEIAEIKASLNSARLVTLTGSGGTGKTRLSIEVGTQLLSRFSNGVWLIELAPLSDESQIIPALAQAFGLQELPFNPLKNLVIDYLRDKKLLLILDNCEHLIAACARLADELLHQCAGLNILASSREALGIAGEVAYRTPSLADSESTNLFVDRARAANSKFSLTDSNASSVAQICHRLDGIPLAIELAAARTKILSADQIASRLDDLFRLLVGGSRTALPRQQTLRALIDWSYDLLSEEEKNLLRIASVFVGGWTLEALEAISEDLHALEHLEGLVNKSLVVTEERESEMRYFLLETIRQYAHEKLLENGEGEGTRSRHFIYYLAMAETAFPEMLTREKELEWIKKLEIEYDNIRVAVKWGLATNLIAAMRLVRSLTYLFVVTSYAIEAHGWGEAVLEQVKLLTDNGKILTSDENLHRARLLAAMSIMSLTMGDSQATAMEAEQATTLLRSLGDKWTLAFALTFHASGKLATGKFNEAIASTDEALRLAEELGDKYILGTVMSAASAVEFFVNRDFAKADTFREKASELLREHGSRWSYGITVAGFGNLLIRQGQFQKARVELNSAMQTMQELGSTRDIVNIKSDLAHILRREGKYIEAIPAYQETIKEWQRMGHRSAVAHQLECLAFIAKAMEQPDQAARMLGAAEALRQKIEIDMTPSEREEYDKEVADLKANRDEKEFSSLWAEGRSMTMDEAIELAVQGLP